MDDRSPVVDLLALDATQLQQLMEQGQLTSVSLVRQILAQVDRENHTGMRLNAMISVAREKLLLETAAQLDAEREQGRVRGPLHGIPIIVKDAIATHPDLGMGTTAGSFALVDSRPAKSATVVEKLIERGMIVLGKTNLNEFCNWKGVSTTNGWSPVGNQTISAYVEGGLKNDDGKMGHSNPAGSSTGSAVGVSAGFSPVSLGTETDGSLVQPAGRAALYALKPTIGSVHMDGVWPVSAVFDAVGAMAKSVADLAAVTEILLQDHARKTLPATGFEPSLTRSFKNLRVGFLDPAEWHFSAKSQVPVQSAIEQMNGTYKKAIAKIEECGAQIKYPVSIPLVPELLMNGESAITTVIYCEYRDNVNGFLSALEHSKVRTLEDIIDFNLEHADQELPEEYPDQLRLIRASEERPSNMVCESAKAHCHAIAREKGIDNVLKEYNLDLLAMPMDCPIPSIAAASGYPLATMPLGTLDFNGRPFGLALMAKAGDEKLMFQFMSAFEANFPKRKVPPLLRNREKTYDFKL